MVQTPLRTKRLCKRQPARVRAFTGDEKRAENAARLPKTYEDKSFQLRRAASKKMEGWLKTFDEHDYDRMKMLASGGTAEDTTQSEESSAGSSAPHSPFDPPSPPTPHKYQFAPLRMPVNLLTVK